MSRNKIFIPVLAIFCLLLMVVWLAGGFQNKLAPAISPNFPPIKAHVIPCKSR